MLFLVAIPAIAQTPPASPVPLAKALLEELRKGGYTLFLAQPETKPGADKPQAGEWWKDCFLSRNLTESGFATARSLGVAFRRLAIPLQEVRASEFCRSLNAGSAFAAKGEPPRMFAALNPPVAQPGKSKADVAKAMLTLLSTPPAPGSNLVVIADPPATDVSPEPTLPTLGPGEVAVLKPLDDDRLVMVTRLTPGQWNSLIAESEAKPATGSPTSAPTGYNIATSGPLQQKPLIDPAVELKGAALIVALRHGGYVLHMRHGEATVGNDVNLDVVPHWKDICELQRNLNPIGRDNARKVGAAMRELQIPVGAVYTSQFCRARETARLMGFDNAAMLEEFNFPSGQKVLRNATELRIKRLSEAPAAGTNTLIVAHTVVKPELEIDKPIFGSTFAEIIVFKPDGKGGTQAIGQIKVADWEAMLKAAKGS